MSSRWVALSVAIITALLVGGRSIAADDPEPKAQEPAPTQDQFYLRVESLVDNVDDLDVRRFTILAPGQGAQAPHRQGRRRDQGLPGRRRQGRGPPPGSDRDAPAPPR